MANKFVLTLLLISYAIGLVIACRTDEDELKEYLEAISLVNKKCGSKEIQECFNLIDKAIARQRKKIALLRDSTLLAGLEKISCLRGVFESPSCTNEEYSIFEKITSFSIGHQPESPHITFKPFDLIVHVAGLSRARTCTVVYQKAFIDNFNSLEEDEFGLVRFVGQVLDKKEGMNNREYMKWLIDFKFATKEKNINHILDYIDQEAADDPDKCEFHDMVQKYVLDPCNRFVSKVKVPEVNQMLFDATMFKAHEGYDFDEGKLDILFPLYRTVAQCAICRKIEDFSFGSALTKKWVENQKKSKTCLESTTVKTYDEMQTIKTRIVSCHGPSRLE